MARRGATPLVLKLAKEASQVQIVALGALWGFLEYGIQGKCCLQH